MSCFRDTVDSELITYPTMNPEPAIPHASTVTIRCNRCLSHRWLTPTATRLICTAFLILDQTIGHHLMTQPIDEYQPAQ